MAAVCAPELPVEMAYVSDSADDQDFWEELGKPSSQGETGSTERRVMMGPHSVWCNDSSTDMEALRLDFPDSFPPDTAEDDLHDTTPEVPIPCMAQLLEKEIKANEEMPMTACRGPRAPCMGLPVALSCSDLTSSGCNGVPCMIPSQPIPIHQPVRESAALMGADAKVVESRPQLSTPQLRPRHFQPGAAICRAAVRRAAAAAPTAWRGCQKNPWCNRETRHRGVCNARAAAPGFIPPQQDAVVFESSQHELDCLKEEEEPCDDHNDSEQASATEVKCEGCGDAPQSARRKGPRHEFMAVPMPLTPTVAPPCMPPQESLESCRSADSSMPREEETRDAGDICSPSIPAAVVLSAPAIAPPTPRAVTQRAPKRGIKAIAAPNSPVTPVPPVEEAAGEYQPEAMDVAVPQVAPGCVQLSSGRIARPTSKTAPSRASSAELSETCPSDEGRASEPKRKGGRQSRSAEKAAKRRRMVGGVLKTVGAAAPGQQCTQCGTQVTPVWRAGPYGPKTLCNACGVRYMKQVKKK